MKTKVAMIFGGRSVEHEVSVISGLQACANMKEEKYEIIPVYMSKDNYMYIGEDIGNIENYKDIDGLIKKSQRVIMINEEGRVKLISYPLKKFGKNVSVDVDVVFPIVHGTNVEDGALQGFFKTLGAPFVGCDVTASAVGMDKYFMKAILKERRVPVLEACTFSISDYQEVESLTEKIEDIFVYPVIVKPVNLGSSVGINVARGKGELISAIDDAFKYAGKIIVERAITKLKEVNCAVLGDENEAMASECEEPFHSEDILSYEDKYVNNAKGSGSKGMAGVSRKIPADISAERREEIRELAVKAFKALGCNGVARIDFMIDEENDKLYFNEINTIPGSLAFYLWEPLGISYPELLDKMIELALRRNRREEALTFTFDVNILSTAALGGSKGSGSKL